MASLHLIEIDARTLVALVFQQAFKVCTATQCTHLLPLLSSSLTWNHHLIPIMAAPKVLSLSGKKLKLDSSQDLERETKLDSYNDFTLVEEFDLSDNSVGVDAAKSLSSYLSKMTSLKV